MYVKQFNVNGFKNLKNISFQPDSRYNIIIGDNAQGKTNLIEAIYMATGCKSFRGSKYNDCIEVNSQKFTIDMTFADSRRDQKLLYEAIKSGYAIKKEVTLNGVKSQPTTLFDTFKCIYFTPFDIELIRSGPDKRRTFVDMAACQINPTFLKHIVRHENLMGHINSLLKKIMRQKADFNELEPFFSQECKVGAVLSFMRNDYIKKLNVACQDIYSKITDGKETLTVEYDSDAFFETDFEKPFGEDMHQIYYMKMKSSITSDIARGYTNRGLNHDNVIIKINGMPAKEFGSQGQIKSATLAIKLAQAEIYSRKIKEPPVILLDDVMGELDEKRQRLVYDLIQDKQVFITTPNISSLLSKIDAKVYQMKDGRIYEL